MKIYRCCGDEELNAYKNGTKWIKEYGQGTNTFNYSANDKCIHFFLFAESMYHYKENVKSRFTKYFIECDMPFETLKKYYGYGYYERVIPGYYAPIPEFAIPIEEFDINCISNISSEPKEEWLRPKDWEKYKNNIPKEYLADIYDGEFVNPKFNELSILEVPIEKMIGHMTKKRFFHF